MRLFVAVDLSEPARRAIEAEQRRIARALDPDRSSLKWVDPRRMHVTLVFLGDVADADSTRIIAAMTPDVELEPFTLAFERLGVFPSRGAPRALWLGIGAGTTALAALQHAVAARLKPLTDALEDPPFSAHLTLGRWRDGRPSERARALALDRRETVTESAVDSVALYHSRLSSAGPTYTALARANLRPCPRLSS
jgi:2'-5' RNA ligase